MAFEDIISRVSGLSCLADSMCKFTASEVQQNLPSLVLAHPKLLFIHTGQMFQFPKKPVKFYLGFCQSETVLLPLKLDKQGINTDSDKLHLAMSINNHFTLYQSFLKLGVFN